LGEKRKLGGTGGVNLVNHVLVGELKGREEGIGDYTEGGTKGGNEAKREGGKKVAGNGKENSFSPGGFAMPTVIKKGRKKREGVFTT